MPGRINGNKSSVNNGAGHEYSSCSRRIRESPALWVFGSGKLHHCLCPASCDQGASSPLGIIWAGKVLAGGFWLSCVCSWSHLMSPTNVTKLHAQLFVHLLVFIIYIGSRNHFLGPATAYHSLLHCALCAVFYTQ